MNYIPPIAIMAFFLVIVLVVLRKFDGDGLVRALEKANFVLVFASFLFVVVGVIHLFQAQDWTPDLLKVIAGIVVGASTAAGSTKSTGQFGGLGVTESSFGDNARLAGRDINEMIESMHGDVAEIKNSVINQFSKVTTALEESGMGQNNVTEFLFYTSFPADGEPVNDAAKAVRMLQESGWTLFSTSSSYAAGDGLVLVLRRIRSPREDDQPLPSGGYRVRIYHGLNNIEMDYQ